MADNEAPPTGETLVFGEDRIHITTQIKGRSWFVGRANDPPFAVLSLVESEYRLSPRDRSAERTTGVSWKQLVSDFV
jgi:hypothetical protein